MKLTWNDLLIEDITPEEGAQWLGNWSGLFTDRVAPAFMNKFGTWFLRRPNGTVDMLDVFSGDIERVAESNEDLVAKTNDPAWQNVIGVRSAFGWQNTELSGVLCSGAPSSTRRP